MKGYCIRRILQMIPVFFAILVTLFVIIELSPGNPLSGAQDPRMTAEQRAALEVKFGLHRSGPEKFFTWIIDTARGDLGMSTVHRRPVTAVLADALVPTVVLSFSALIFSMLVGIPLGILSAVKKGKIIDHITAVFSFIGISMPGFFFGLLLIWGFAITLGVSPVFGFSSNPLETRNFTPIQRVLDIAWHLTLPTIVLGLSNVAQFMRYTRSSMLEVIKQDYIRTARSKGLRESTIIFHHAFRNATIPIITLLGIIIPTLISGAAITESVFGLPGIGRIAVEAATSRNYPIIIGVAVMVSLATLIASLLADICYAAADPRIRYE